MTQLKVNTYDGQGKFRTSILIDDRIKRLDAVRKFVTLYELELFEIDPSEEKLAYWRQQIASVVETL